MRYPPPDLERILARSERAPNGCFLYQGTLNPETGHGRISIRCRTKRVHRVMWELLKGPIPEGLCVLHKCDHPACFEIEHLFLGTVLVNNADRDSKGRQAHGDGHGRAKLTTSRVKTMRYAHRKYDIPIGDMAVRYGVTYPAARFATLGLTWRHV